MHEIILSVPLARNAYHYHQTVWRLMEREEGSPRDFIFRAVPAPGGSGAFVKVRANQFPAMLAERCIPVTSLRVGKRYTFSVLCHPVRRNDKGEQPIRRPEDATTWLTRLMKLNGMSILETEADFQTSMEIRKTETEKGGRMHAVNFVGVLEVLDSDRANTALRNGVGRGKSMGFGLLEVEAVQ